MNHSWIEFGILRKLLKKRLRDVHFDTWQRQVKPIQLTDSDARVAVPNKFIRDWIQDHFQKDVETALAELTGVKPPKDIDGVSVLGTLLGKKKISDDRFLYWEFYERGFQQALRWRDFKAVRLAPDKPLELYNLAEDLAESRNVADQHGDVVAKIEDYLTTARTQSPHWSVERAVMKNAKKKNK